MLAGGLSFALAELIAWPTHLIGLMLQCGISATAGLLLYGGLASWARVPEATQISRQLGGQILRRLPLKR